MLEGGCGCGRVRYRLLDAPITVNCCHCRDCQRRSGTAFAINAMIELDRIELFGSTAPEAVEDEGGNRSWVCPGCSVLLFADHSLKHPDIRFVRAGTLDESERLVPDAHYFTRSKHPWIVLPPGVPAYATLPEGGGTTLAPDKAARMARAWR